MKNNKNNFITYAHRGASEYCPENTLMSFYMGMQMGANGIETDVKITKDGVLVLFHDDTLERVTGKIGKVSDYTYSELSSFKVKKGDLTDKIPTLEDFLSHFAYRDITFAIELKDDNIEKEVGSLIYKYGIENKAIVTAFEIERIKNVLKYYPNLKVGYLTQNIDESVINELININAYEICPEGKDVTPERVCKWHSLGLNVRAWGIYNEDIMKSVFDAGADGMTVNFPDKLLEYIKKY